MISDRSICKWMGGFPHATRIGHGLAVDVPAFVRLAGKASSVYCDAPGFYRVFFESGPLRRTTDEGITEPLIVLVLHQGVLEVAERCNN